MGVVHKLKDEVVEFILATKRDSPKISVRQLADASSQRFQTQISKSSVSNILKSNQLNSRVGRPISDKDLSGKQFSIPSAKKNQIRQSMEQIGFKPTVEDKPKAGIPVVKKAENVLPKVERIKESWHEPKPVLPQEEFKETILKNKKEESPVPKIEIEEKQEDPVVLPQQPAPQAVIEPLRVLSDDEDDKQDSSIASAKAKWYAKRNPTYKAMGIVFLQAASLALTKKSFLAEVLGQFIRHDDLLYFHKLCQAEVFCRGIEHFNPTAQVNFSNAGFWQFLGFNGAIARQEFQQRLVQLTLSPELLMNYTMEKEQLSLKSAFIKIVLQDGTHFTIDARGASLWAGVLPSDLDAPLNITVDILSREIIANTKPFVLGVFPSMENAPQFLDNMINVFNLNGLKQIKRAILIDSNQREVAQFTTIPQMKRKFIFPFYQYHESFTYWQKFFSPELKYQSYYQPLTDQVYFCRSVLVNYPSQEEQLKCVEVAYPKTKKPFCFLMTNDLESSQETIIHEYFRSWPYALEGMLGCFYDKKPTRPKPVVKTADIFADTDKIIGTEELFIDYFRLLHRALLSFVGANLEPEDINWFVEHIYLKEGALALDSQEQYFFFPLDSDPKINKVLDLLSRAINELNIIDERGKKISISIC